jgi:hypothetical protein
LALPGRERLRVTHVVLIGVPHFEECSPGVTMNPEFILWEHHGTLPIVVNYGCWFDLALRGGKPNFAMS